LGERADDLLDADDAFLEAKRASDFIKKNVVDPTTLKPTRGGRVATSLIKEGDVTTREALRVLKESSRASKKSINKAIKSLASYNQFIKVKRVGQKITNYAILGGVAGSIGGKSAGQFLDRNEVGN
jgi:hypothetical protein